jgi:hypothetical protein
MMKGPQTHSSRAPTTAKMILSVRHALLQDRVERHPGWQ